MLRPLTQRLGSSLGVFSGECMCDSPFVREAQGRLLPRWRQWWWPQTWGSRHRRSCPMWPWTRGCHRSTGHSSPPGRRRGGTCSVAQLAATYLPRRGWGGNKSEGVWQSGAPDVRKSSRVFALPWTYTSGRLLKSIFLSLRLGRHLNKEILVLRLSLQEKRGN